MLTKVLGLLPIRRRKPQKGSESFCCWIREAFLRLRPRLVMRLTALKSLHLWLLQPEVLCTEKSLQTRNLRTCRSRTLNLQPNSQQKGPRLRCFFSFLIHSLRKIKHEVQRQHQEHNAAKSAPAKTQHAPAPCTVPAGADLNHLQDCRDFVYKIQPFLVPAFITSHCLQWHNEESGQASKSILLVFGDVSGHGLFKQTLQQHAQPQT